MNFSLQVAFGVVVTLLVVVRPADAQQTCQNSHCDVNVARLAIAGEDCAAQIFDPSQTQTYSQLVTAAKDFAFPFPTPFPVSVFDDRFDGNFSGDDPGYTAASNPCAKEPLLSALPGQKDLHLDILTQTPSAGGSPRSLLFWDGLDDDGNGLDENDVEWSAVPNDEIINIEQTNVEVTADGGTSEIEGLRISNSSSSGSIHSHARYELRRSGGGLASLGVYLIRFDLTMDTFAEGAPIYMVFSTISTAANSNLIAAIQVENEILSPLCSDGVDNDRDGFVDYAGGDPGCDSAADTSEKSPLHECDDGIDNDGDGKIDFRASNFGSADLYAMRDLQCGSPTDPTGEAVEPVSVPSLAPSAMFLLCLLLGLAGSRSLRALSVPRA